jgi:hypothetical protein
VSGVGNSAGGNITFFDAPVSGTTVTRLRKQPASQLSDYVPNEAVPAERIELDLDKLVMQIQQIREQLKRGFFLPKSSALIDQGIAVPTDGLFARAKTGGGIDWATPTNASPAALPISIANGGTGAITQLAALAALGASEIQPTDVTFRIRGSSDQTKKAAFEVDGIAASTTRTYTLPDRNLTIGTTLTSEQPSTSGTAIDFTGIPAGTRRITVMLVDVVRSGTSNIIVQIGDSGGIEISGYNNATSILINAAPVGLTNSAAGWVVASVGSAAAVISGCLTLQLEETSGVRWVGSGTLVRTDVATVLNLAGQKSLTAVLDRVRITMANGTDTFTGGVINISYE